MHKHMKQASAKDDLLCPVCPGVIRLGAKSGAERLPMDKVPNR